MDEALKQLSGGHSAVAALGQSHAEAGTKAQRLAAEGKMTWKLFEAYRLPELKAENPGLKSSQYRDALRKEWSRSSMNPKNMRDQPG